LSLFRVKTTSRSRPLMFAGTGIVTSTSPIDWTHLYGRAACSASSLALSSWSAFSRSSAVGEGGEDMIKTGGLDSEGETSRQAVQTQMSFKVKV
jgi:hypothetical protein